MKRQVVRALALAAEGRPQEDKLVVLSGKKIERILPATVAGRFDHRDFISSRRYLVFPGLVDIHCHGGGEGNTNTVAGLLAVAYFHASHGTTAMLLSIFFKGCDDLTKMAGLVKAARSLAPLHLLGLHLEGPYLNPAARGSIPSDGLCPVKLRDITKIVKAAQNELKVITIAPELPQAESAIRAFHKAGVVVALGHSLATVAQARAGADKGATLVTHLGNGMRPFHQREPGLIGVGLSDPRLAAEIIADGHHLAPETLSMFLRGKVGDMVLVSDCRRSGGTDEKLVVKEGAAYLADNTLAGSIHPLWKGLRTIASLPGMSIWDVVRLAARNPAGVLKKRGLGRIRVNGRADLVLTGPDLSVRRVFFGGQEIFRAANETC
ncbi:amidohydrolase family protein [bacterium]|nr:amidohydrolase family protein [bacterium]